MRKRLLFGSSLLAATMFVLAVGGEEFKSGLAVGDKAPAFQVRNVTGQNCAVDYAKDDRGSLCYR